MKFVKEYWRSSDAVIVRINKNTFSLEDLKKVVTELRKDFPSAPDAEIRILDLDQPMFRYQSFGVLYKTPEISTPKEYRRVEG